MPEGPEIRIMSDFINQVAENKIFNKAFHVLKGNNPVEFEEKFLTNFTVRSRYYGKKLIVELICDKKIPIFIFMGMSGSWKFVDTNNWKLTRFTRLKFDTLDGKSLILYGGYMGPKYSVYNNFKGSKDGPDIIQDFELFVEKISNSLDKKIFKKPIYELLLNQEYFAGIGNYLRSTILYYANVNPFTESKYIIENNPNFLSLCRDILQQSYEFNGGQLKDWSNPFQKESKDFDDWVYYQKGIKIIDSTGRTFWYDPKWKA